MRRLTALLFGTILLISFTACANPKMNEAADGKTKALPIAEPDTDNQFGVDKNITIENIDAYLGREDTVYRDMRMLFDPADYESIGGEADLSSTIQGFKVVPYPYIASLNTLPVSGAYDGDCLFAVQWAEDGSIKMAKANYEESTMALEELFPKDKNIILTCGGGGYAGMMRSLLIHLGWDESKLYNIGGAWQYKGDNKLEIISYPEDANEDPIFATWRADYAYIDFARLHKSADKNIGQGDSATDTGNEAEAAVQ